MKPTVFLLVLVLLLSGCGGGSSPTPTPMTGTWKVRATSNFSSQQVIGVATLTQTKDAISGQLTLIGTPCAVTAILTGTLAGHSLVLDANEEAQIVTFDGTADSAFATASGAYASPAGGCLNGDSGNWIAVKQ